MAPINKKWAAIPHYLANDHHPEHISLKRRHPDLLPRLYLMNKFTSICELLKGVYEMHIQTSCEEEMCEFLNYDELAIDLIARRWQKDFPFERVVNKMQLSNVYSYAFLKGNSPQLITF